MTEPTRKPRKSADNVRWPDRTRTERQTRRRDKLHAKAVELGYGTWYKVETAIIEGAIKLVKVDETDNEKL